MEPSPKSANRHYFSAIAVLFSGAIFAFFVFGMVLFAMQGGPFVNALSEQIGEVVALRATDRAAAGDHAQAVEIYKTALSCRFEDEPMQRIYAMLRLAKSYTALQRPAEAVSVLEEAFTLNSAYGPTYTMLFAALRTSDVPRALAITEQHITATRAAGDVTAQKWATYNKAVLMRDSGKKEEALAAFRESHALQPSQETAYQSACLQLALGKYAEAEASVQEVLQIGDSQYTALAQPLLEKINARKSSG